MDIEIRHLRMMEMIARQGGMTPAAKRLYVTQSALSHQLREIEEKLGTKLFVRAGRKMILTEAGRRMLDSAQAVLKELHSAEEDLRRMTEGKEGTLRISTQCNTCYHWLPALIKRFHERFPGVEVEINVDATQDPLAALWAGDLDLALLFRLPTHRGLTTYRLFEDEMMAIMHPQHPLSRKSFLRPDDFRAENLIVYKTPRENSLLFQKVLDPGLIRPRKITQVMLTEAILEMVKAGFGIGVLSHWFSAPYVREKTVRAVRITKNGIKRKWLGATLAGSGNTPYIEEFTRLLSRNSLPARVKIS